MFLPRHPVPEPKQIQTIDPSRTIGLTSMSLLSIIEPAGTLATGWSLLPKEPGAPIDLRDPSPVPVDVDPLKVYAADLVPELPRTATRSKWELSERELCEIG
jgi:hypothetical protein